MSVRVSIGLDITVKILQLAKLNDKPDTSMSAADLSTRQKKEKPIITFSKSIDCMLGGGIPIGQITEFTGVPGIGIIRLLHVLLHTVFQ
jgi:RAD51-like protein 2